MLNSIIELIVIIRDYVRKYTKYEVSVYAAQTSFFIALSAFPLLMLLLAIIQVIPSLSEDDLINILSIILPNNLQNAVTYIIDAIYTESPAAILSISGILALWSASKGMFSIETGLNKIWDVKKKRNYIIDRIICMGYTIVFIVVTILQIFVLILGDSINNAINKHIPFLAEISDKIIGMRTITAVIVLCIFFLGTYVLIPNKKISFISQLPGAIFTSGVWIGFSFGFSIYFNNFSNYSYMYGSLAAIVLIMLWLYFCICILFAGALINKTFFAKKDLSQDTLNQS